MNFFKRLFLKRTQKPVTTSGGRPARNTVECRSSDFTSNPSNDILMTAVLYNAIASVEAPACSTSYDSSSCSSSSYDSSYDSSSYDSSSSSYDSGSSSGGFDSGSTF